MAVERIFFNAAGAIDGANTSYVLPADFVAGTVKPFVNGQLVGQQLYVETPPRTVVLEHAPLPGDSVMFFAEVA